MITQITDSKEKEHIAESILTQLPDWFGLPESTKEYIKTSKTLPFWSYTSGNKPVGFIVLKETGKHTAEIYVMGVLKEYHGRGIGKALFETFQKYAREQKYEYIQVKTVAKGHYKEYDQTNAFYEHLGFRELECLPTLWDEWNPCQIYIKYISFSNSER